MPFCSERCRQIDLGRWLREQNSIPISDADEDGDEEPRDRETTESDDF